MRCVQDQHLWLCTRYFIVEAWTVDVSTLLSFCAQEAVEEINNNLLLWTYDHLLHYIERFYSVITARSWTAQENELHKRNYFRASLTGRKIIKIRCSSESTSTLNMAAKYGWVVCYLLLNCVDIITGLPEQGVRKLRLFTVRLCWLSSLNRCCAWK